MTVNTDVIVPELTDTPGRCNPVDDTMSTLRVCATAYCVVFADVVYCVIVNVLS